MALVHISLVLTPAKALHAWWLRFVWLVYCLMVQGKSSEPELLKDHLGDPEQLRESLSRVIGCPLA